ncbi:hypothetical protein [Candidatus Nitrospira nitrificans]|uniref:MotA/TolQ/ExbB proton channel domain-containing protein n=1 Tax=Candidatus Nitrospira nitrificans TaxID=1742973 RepID=A0A0S4LHB1_9BACT|nr:hypothetical protein [Candidatus Nitrospira nitrificans]CUS35350.1 conserved hypothetical protein [Candidatus Nitrospira nitrificans]
MDEVDQLTALWEWLTRDVTVVGGLQSPALSWIGAAGILTLCIWHGAVLLRGLLQIQGTLARFHSSVAPLVLARQQVSKDWLVIPALAKKRARLDVSSETRRDLDDLHALDRAVRSEQDFARDWFSYRKTLAVEQPAWFLEPTVHSQRAASEFFSFESLCAAHLNVRFYRQLPAFMTGMGLMFTFLAILIGLSKLHANGSEIDGIQGLINGLSGKFVTSIVGLACANAFTLLEHSFWHRLDNRHRECISLLDEMFPQRATDQHSPGAPSSNGSPAALVAPIRHDTAHQLVEVVQQRLGSTVEALNSASKALTALNSKHSPMKLDDLPVEIGHEVQRALRPMMNPLLEAIHALNRSMKERASPVQLSQAEIETMFQDLRNTTTVTTEPARVASKDRHSGNPSQLPERGRRE